MPYANEQPIIHKMVSLADDTWIIYAEYSRTSCMAVVHRRMTNETSGAYYVYTLNPDTNVLFCSGTTGFIRPSRIQSWSLSFESVDHDEMTMIRSCIQLVFQKGDV